MTAARPRLLDLYCGAGGAARDLADGKDAMGVNWDVTWNELKEMVPPTYTRFIGLQMIVSGVV